MPLFSRKPGRTPANIKVGGIRVSLFIAIIQGNVEEVRRICMVPDIKEFINESMLHSKPVIQGLGLPFYTHDVAKRTYTTNDGIICGALGYAPPIWFAAAMGNIEIARILIDHGAIVNIHHINLYGKTWDNLQTPLQIAKHYNHTDMVNFLNEYLRSLTVKPKSVPSESNEAKLLNTTPLLTSVNHGGKRKTRHSKKPKRKTRRLK